MEISGSYTFDAPPELVWSLLHDPVAMKQALPGCEYFHLHADGKYHISLAMPSGPFSGGYEGIVTRLGEQSGETITLAITGSGPEVVLAGEGTLTLKGDEEQTLLIYEGAVDVSGQLPSRSPRLTRTTANYMIRSFMEALDRQLSQTTGTLIGNGRSPDAAIPVERSTPTIGMDEFLAEIRRDRRVAAAVVLLLLLAALSVVGGVVLVFLSLRWLMRLLAGDN